MPETDDYAGPLELTAIGDLLTKGRDTGLDTELVRTAMQLVAQGLDIEEACARAADDWLGVE